ncbi:hypothetical protein FSARC_3043 [Fusarium sarcochroum]|uniref:Uncharacterized protein n=1 Tax=Fusarium sarcochroum TaxID=1208366 RepID=A0A8H4U5F1_9HYPO|nr:hypothetical protein FSARC_3043 [Fusarium sarcochroum]
MAKSRSRPSHPAMQKASGINIFSTEPQARLYVIVHFARKPYRYLWDFAIHDDAAELWTSYSAEKTCESEYPTAEICEKVPEPEISNCHIGYLELAKIPSSRVSEIEELCNMVRVPEIFEEAPCCHQYVRNIVNDLIWERIICQTKADSVFARLDERNEKLRTRNIRPHYRERLCERLGGK